MLMKSLHCRAVLFDMDGVLVDSTAAVARVWTVWARKQGLDADTVVKIAHGRPSISTIRELLPRADHDAEDREVERMEIEDVEGIVALPGAAELLRALSANRYAIVTSATRPLAEVRLRAAGLPVPENLVTASDVQCGKPNPDPYLMGAKILGVPPEECVVIEDAPSGVRAGKAAGARVVALRTTASDAEFQEAGADWIVENCAELFVEIPAHSEEFLLLGRRTN
jgi:mannitol-1-/sugar-/sorbitol-6-phosphatase